VGNTHVLNAVFERIKISTDYISNEPYVAISKMPDAKTISGGISVRTCTFVLPMLSLLIY